MTLVTTQARQGFRKGKWGFAVTTCPYAPGDQSEEAKAWRMGWVRGAALFEKANG